jgi:hypothetical protein
MPLVSRKRTKRATLARTGAGIDARSPASAIAVEA